MKTNVIIFSRVSTKEQDTQRQINDLQELCIRNNWNVSKIITETISGNKRNEKRKGIAELYETISKQNIDKVVVTEISRLGRRTLEVLKVIERLTKLKVSVYIDNYNLETLTRDGKRNVMANLMLTILAEFAQMERETISDRTKSGLVKARKNGKVLGRPKGEKEPTEILKKHNDIVKLLDIGLSLRQIGKAVGKSPNTVRKVKSVHQRKTA